MGDCEYDDFYDDDDTGTAKGKGLPGLQSLRCFFPREPLRTYEFQTTIRSLKNMAFSKFLIQFQPFKLLIFKIPRGSMPPHECIPRSL